MKTNKLLNPLSLFFVGLFLGALSRLFDMYYPNLGEIFSQMPVWILLGTLIAIYSPTKKAAMRNILPFCIGMLLTYYATAMLTQSVYGWTFIIGWTIFAFLSPVMAYFAWMTKEWGLFPKIIVITMNINRSFRTVTASFLPMKTENVFFIEKITVTSSRFHVSKNWKDNCLIYTKTIYIFFLSMMSVFI